MCVKLKDKKLYEYKKITEMVIGFEWNKIIRKYKQNLRNELNRTQFL